VQTSTHTQAISRNCSPMSLAGCSTSTRTRQWSTPGTATTRRSGPNVRTLANGVRGVGDPQAFRQV